MGKAAQRVRGEHQKEVAKLFESLSPRHNGWQVWQDFIHMAACEISIRVDASTRRERAESYNRVSEKYTPAEKTVLAKMLAEVVDAMEENQEQDFLGDLFMSLELGNDWKGQFFTPYNLCAMMARMECEGLPEKVAQEGWVAVNDPACGAGATLIGTLAECKRHGVRQDQVLFVAQDLDMIAAQMCYIQLSLLGVAGYVCIGDTLAHPCITIDPRGLISAPGQNIWYTPGFCIEPWSFRRLLARPCKPKKGD